MKLANALSQRSELQTRIRQLESRLNNNAQVQEGNNSGKKLDHRAFVTICSTPRGGGIRNCLVARKVDIKPQCAGANGHFAWERTGLCLAGSESRFFIRSVTVTPVLLQSFGMFLSLSPDVDFARAG